MIALLEQLTHLDDSQLSLLVESLSSRDQAEAASLIRQSIQWTALAGPQSLAYMSPADELFFGGKAGAGKSDLLIGLGLTQHRKTLILRREATQLQEIVTRLRETMGTADKFRGSGYGGVCTTWDGRTIELAGCEHEKDRQKYKGRAHDLKCWDEVVDFPESVYKFVNGWNRTTTPGQRCRVVCASNPPTTAEGEWVIRHWRAWLDTAYKDRAAPGELRYYTTIGENEEEFPNAEPVLHKGETYYPRSRTFIPGDMIELLKATGYANTLATLPEPLRSIYLKGDFGASKQDHRWQLIPSAWVESARKRWVERKAAGFGPLSSLGVDVAMEGKDWTCIAPRHGATIDALVKRKGKDTPDGATVCDLMLKAGAGANGVKSNIDAIGIGKSAYDSAKLLGIADVYPIVVSEGTTWRDPKISGIRFGNLRAAMMWKVRSLLDPEGEEWTRLALPPDDELAADLCAPRYRQGISGIMVESKDDIRERIGRSTDAGDSVGLACWEKSQVTFTTLVM